MKPTMTINLKEWAHLEEKAVMQNTNTNTDDEEEEISNRK